MRGQWKAGGGFRFLRKGNTCADFRGERPELRVAGARGDVLEGGRCWVLKTLLTFALSRNYGAK